MMNKYGSRALPLDGGFIKVISYRSDSESNNDQWRRFLAAFVFCFFFLSGLSPRSVLAGGARPTPTDRGEEKKERVCIVLALHGGVVVLVLSPDPSLPNSGSSRLFVARRREAHGG